MLRSRQETRQPTNHHEVLDVYVRRLSDGGEFREPVELLDVSPGGFKARSPVPLQFDESVIVTFTCFGEHTADITLDASVCWMRPDDDSWILGCSIRPPLDRDAYEQIVGRGIVERRQSERLDFVRPAQFHWELEPTPRKGFIKDLSGHGCCAFFTQEPQAGRRLIVRLSETDDGSKVRGCVRWTYPWEKGFLGGVEFVEPVPNTWMSLAD